MRSPWERMLTKTSHLPTVTDNLFTQGVITAHEVAVSFEPTQSESSTNGELTFGGTDSTKFTGSITFAYVDLRVSHRAPRMTRLTSIMSSQAADAHVSRV